jgi:hypothetical protein
MTEKMYTVISKESRTGISRSGKPYCFEYLIVNFNGKPARVVASRDKEAYVGDCVVLGLATKKGCGCADIIAAVKEVIPAEAKGE